MKNVRAERLRIPIGWCAACGRPEAVRTEKLEDGRTRVTIACTCSPECTRETVVGAGEDYTLVLGGVVETEEEGGTKDAGDASRNLDAHAEGGEADASAGDPG